ncbi:MAG: peptide chain release factor N(5)-glutamine methyltransferase [Victivallaceae bacterium]
MTIRSLIEEGSRFLEKQGVPFPRREARYLLIDILGIDTVSALLSKNLMPDEESVSQYHERIFQRGRRRPSQYIEGRVLFYGLQLMVEEGVLIPRQETEILASLVSDFFNNKNIREGILWDLCCGSGCLGLSLKKKHLGLEVSLFDISDKATTLSAENAAHNGLDVSISKANVFCSFDGSSTCDYLICNPPYLSFREILNTAPEVRCFEPWLALYGGAGGLEFYVFLAENLMSFLKPKGKLWLELGFRQGSEVKAIFEKNNYFGECIKDFSGVDRFFFLEMDK